MDSVHFKQLASHISQAKQEQAFPFLSGKDVSGSKTELENTFLELSSRITKNKNIPYSDEAVICALLQAPTTSYRVEISPSRGQQDDDLRFILTLCVYCFDSKTPNAFYASIDEPETISFSSLLSNTISELNVTLQSSPLSIVPSSSSSICVVKGSEHSIKRLETRSYYLPGVPSSIHSIPIIKLPTEALSDPSSWFSSLFGTKTSKIDICSLNNIELPSIESCSFFIFEKNPIQSNVIPDDDPKYADFARQIGVPRDGRYSICSIFAGTMIDIFKHRVALTPNEIGFVWLIDGEKVGESLTFSDIWSRSTKIATALQKKNLNGKPALLLFHPDEGAANFLSVWGCILSGTIGVPIAPPDPKDLPSSLQRIGAVVRDCGCTTIITTSTLAGMLSKLSASNPMLKSFTVIPVDEILKNQQLASNEYFETVQDRSSIALLQFSSGSTGVPKGVIVTHQAILFNCYSEINAMKLTDRTFISSWLPLYFDMGLIAFVFTPVIGCLKTVNFSPLAFMKNPFCWLKEITEQKIEVTGGPNFAFEQLTLSVSEEMMKEIDLSRLRVLFSGSESVRFQTLDAFSKKFSKVGFKYSSFMPVYGLAEACLIVSGTLAGQEPVVINFDSDKLEHGIVEKSSSENATGTRTMTSCGINSSGPLYPIKIVDPATLELTPDGRVGEIWVSGPTLAAGYWNKPEVSKLTFQAKIRGDVNETHFLRTGDLGFIYDGNLFISGRAKDLIIVNGRNHSPIDIETTTEHHSAVLKANSAAFSVEINNSERLVVISEPSETFRKEDSEKVISEIRQLIQEKHGLPLYAYLFIEKGSLPKTDTGKIQRSKCKEAFLKKELKTLVSWNAEDKQKELQQQQNSNEIIAKNIQQKQQQQQSEMSSRAQTIADFLIKTISTKLGTASSAIDIQLNIPFSAYGLGSVAILGLTGELEKLLGTKIQPTIFYEFPTIELLSKHLAGDSDVNSQTTPIPMIVKTIESKEPIAIVGISCRLPGATNKNEFWDLLINGKDAISQVPENRFNVNNFYSELQRTPGKLYVKTGGFISDIDLFDNTFFGISKAESSVMDPQQRLLLMCTQEAFDDCGQPTNSLCGSNTTVSIGLCNSDYSTMMQSNNNLQAISNPFIGTGGANSIASNRISYQYDFHGPSITVDTACSSSLVAMDIASKYLHQGISDVAVVGGVNLILSPISTIALCQAGFLSPDGKCKSFDSTADGFIRSEGVCVVILKTLSKARNDSDRVYSLIASTAVNQDGQSNGLTAPNPISQQQLLREACSRAKISPSSIQYVEAHGTGTALGDPIEVQSLDSVMKIGRDSSNPLLIGSVKTNIGHTEACAGLVGLIKLALSIHNKQIPPSIHFKTPNPKIGFESLNVRVVDKLIPWKSTGGQLIGGVSSFGFGGTNAHIILISPPSSSEEQSKKEEKQKSNPLTLCLSATTGNTLKATVNQFSEWLSSTENVNIEAVCYSAFMKRSPKKYRAAFIGGNKGELISHMSNWISGKSQNKQQKEQNVSVSKTMKQPNKICFVFSGQGTQWQGMGQELYEINSYFHDKCDEWISRFAKLGLDFDLKTEMLAKKPDEKSIYEQTKVAQIVVFIFQICVARYLEAVCGIQCSSVVGHSLGEITAACFAGIISDEIAAKIVFERANLMQKTHGKGKMCAVQLSLEEVIPFVTPFSQNVSIACINSPNSVVISGDEETLLKCIDSIKASKPECQTKLLPVSYVFHSPQLDFAVPLLEEKLNGMKSNESKMTLFSTVTGVSISGNDMNSKYWSLQIRKPVQFSSAINCAIKDGCHTLIEISPHPALSMYMRAIMDQNLVFDGIVLPTFVRSESEKNVIPYLVAQLWTNGCKSNSNPLPLMLTDEESKEQISKVFVELPGRIWDLQSYWITSAPDFDSHSLISSSRIENCLYETQLEEAALAPSQAVSTNNLIPMIFVDENSESFSIGKELMNSFGEKSFAIYLGGSFHASSNSVTVSNNDYLNDISKAVKIAQEQRGCNLIVYCWSNHSSSVNDWNLSVTGLIELSKSLSKSNNVPLVVVTKEAMKVNPIQSMSWGIIRTMASEYPNISSAIVDISSISDIPNLKNVICSIFDKNGLQLIKDNSIVLQNGKQFILKIQQINSPSSNTWILNSTPVNNKSGSNEIYLITGGLGGLGLETAEWISKTKKCKQIILLDKRAPSENIESRIKSLCSIQKCDIRVVVLPLEDRESLSKLISEIGNDLHGIFHFAGVLTRSSFAQLTPKLINESISAKVIGAQNLHDLTLKYCKNIDFFVFSSSISSIIPHFGQGAYSASNCFLDSLAQMRKAMNLPALSIQIGLLGDVGMLKNQSNENIEMIKKLGLFPTSASEIIKVISYFLYNGYTNALFTRVDWKKYAQANDSSMLSKVIINQQTNTQQIGSNEQQETISQKPKARNEAEITEWLISHFSDSLNIPIRELDLNSPLSNYGLQSVTAIDITSQLTHFLGIKVSPNVIYDFPTINSLSKHLSSRLSELASTKSTAPLTHKLIAQQPANSQNVSGNGIEPIAIVGMACKFPGGCNNLNSYWDLLMQGRDAVTEIPISRFDVNKFYDPDPQKPNKINTRCGGFVDSIDLFDADFWQISPREAERLDPQQRICLEAAWEALEDAGIVPSKIAGGKHGVFVGLSVSDYGQQMLVDNNSSDAYFATGSFVCMNANRLSYLLDFQGPSISLDTACSSTTVATHLACNSLRNGECGISIAGGVNAILTPTGALTLTKTGALSPDGKCFTFDSRANGYVRSEGCGMFILKPLSKAMSDKDHIYCSIIGSSVNQDGKSQGLTAPNGLAQQALIEDAYKKANRSLLDVTYIECHGTGTKLGDHIEVNSLGKVLLKYHRSSENKLLIGSVKTNLGHLECASGAASIIKVALSLRNSKIPASIHFQTPNPHIDFNSLPVSVCSKTIEWPQNSPKLCGISSFGFGGTNAHLILESAPLRVETLTSTTTPNSSEPTILTFSAKTMQALFETAKQLAEFVKTNIDSISLKDLSYSLIYKREHHRLRYSVVCGGNGISEKQAMENAIEELFSFAKKSQHTEKLLIPSPQTSPKVAFIFSGQGPQYFGMSKQLYETEPIFKAAMDEIETEFKKQYDHFSVIDEINLKDEKESHLNETICSQRCLFAIQYSLAKLYESRGVIPNVVIGHSLGEIAAACICGHINLSDAVKLIHIRSEIMNCATRLGGKMLAITLSADLCKSLISECGGNETTVSIAAENSQKSCVLSGNSEILEKISSNATTRGIPNKFLPVNYAFHSPQMEKLSLELKEKLKELHLASNSKTNKNNITMISTVTSNEINGDELLTEEYWAKQIRNTVQFHNAIKLSIDNNHHIGMFIEISPHPVLSRYINEITDENYGKTCAMIKNSSLKDERLAFISSIATLHQYHININWDSFFFNSTSVAQPKYIKIPTYAWQKVRFWLPPPQQQLSAPTSQPIKIQSPVPSPPVSAFSMPILSKEVSVLGGGEAFGWEGIIEEHGPLDWAFDHHGFGQVLVMGVTYLEAGLEASQRINGVGMHVLSDIRFLQPLFLNSASATIHSTLTTMSKAESRLICKSPVASESGITWLYHASLVVHKSRALYNPIPKPCFDLQSIKNRCPVILKGKDFYEASWDRGLQLGPCFRSVQVINIGDNELIAELNVPKMLKVNDFVWHPAVLDAAMQCIGSCMCADPEALQKLNGIFLPKHMDRIDCWESPIDHFFVVVKMHWIAKRSICGDVFAVKPNGETMLKISAFECNYVEDAKRSSDVFYENQWIEQTKLKSLPKQIQQNQQCILVLSDNKGISNGIIESIKKTGTPIIIATHNSNKTEIVNKENCTISESATSEEIGKMISGIAKLNNCSSVRVLFAWPIDCEDQKALSTIILLPFIKLLQSSKFSPELTHVFGLTLNTKSISNENENVLNVWQNGISGLCGIAIQECPQIKAIHIDLSTVKPKLNDFELAAIEILSNRCSEDQIAIKNGKVYMNRLIHTSDPATIPNRIETTLSETPCRIEITKPGHLQDLVLRGFERRAPGKNEIEIEVKSASLNFRDVLRALGFYPAVDDSSVVGLDAVGTVVRIGEGVKEIEIGNKVVAITAGGIGTHVTCPVLHCTKIPSNLLDESKGTAKVSYEEMAAMIVPFATAHISLVWHAHMKKGEKVLVHCASGGVGLSAVQMCNSLGCEVFATAGLQEKRDYLINQCGIASDHVFSSRSLAFVDEIKRLTNGKGVDIVLNCLSGEGLFRSFELLSRRGRFVEIGKSDIFQNSKLGMEVFNRNTMFVSVALDEIFDKDPEDANRLLKEVVELIGNGIYKPIKHVDFPLSGAVEAFHLMETAKHIGKIVFTIDPKEKVTVTVPERKSLRSDSTYIVAGLGGMGIPLCEWLYRQGAEHVVALVRSVSKEKMEMLKSIQNSASLHNGTFAVMDCDITSELSVQNCIQTISKNHPQIKGVIQMAGILEDKLLNEVNLESLEHVLAPKVSGSWNLHKATLSIPNLDFFVMFSSIASIMGTIGQTSYAAANSFQDGLAMMRRSQGLPGISINWGPIELGMTARQGKSVVQAMANQGIGLLSKNDFLYMFSSILFPGCKKALPKQLAIIKVDWAKWASVNSGTTAVTRRFSKLASVSGMQSEISKKFLTEYFNLGNEEQRIGKVTDQVVKVVSTVLSLDPTKIDIRRSLSEMGLDSMVSNEVRVKIEQEMGVQISIGVLIGGPPITKVAKTVSDRINSIGKDALLGTNDDDDDDTEENSNGIETNKNRKPVIVCIPGGVTLGEPFSVIEETFGNKANVIILDYGVNIVESVEQTANMFAEKLTVIKKLKCIDALIGYSAGCAFAVETTRKLISKGKCDVKNLVLVDGRNNSRSFTLEESFFFVANTVVPSSKGGISAMRTLLSRINDTFDLSTTTLSVKEQVHKYYQSVANMTLEMKAGLIADALGLPPNETSFALIQRLLSSFYGITTALGKHGSASPLKLLSNEENKHNNQIVFVTASAKPFSGIEMTTKDEALLEALIGDDVDLETSSAIQTWTDAIKFNQEKSINTSHFKITYHLELVKIISELIKTK